MNQKEQILIKRFSKLKSHYLALKDYKLLIDDLLTIKNIYDPLVFSQLVPQEKAILDAYLKRFSSMQDFLGAKIFALLLEISGIGASKMSDILNNIEKEEIIDSLGNWIELREIRNDLEHDYPEDIETALQDLETCIGFFTKLESYYLNALTYVKRYIDEIE